MNLTLRGALRHSLPLILALGVSQTWAAKPALSVEESASFAAAPEVVWKLVGNYGAVQPWLAVVASTEITKGKNNTKGAVRKITTKDGAVIVEELLAYSGKTHSMSYKILESPLPVKDYAATLSVKADGAGSKVVWKSQFKRTDAVDDAKAREIITGIYKAGMDGIKAGLAAPK